MTRRGMIGLPVFVALSTRLAHRGLDLAVPPPRTRILAGGDVMLSRHIGRLARVKNDAAWPLREIAPLFSSADIAFANLESPFLGRGAPADTGMIFKAMPPMAEGLKLAGIDVVSTANNHSRDQGGDGILYTLDLLGKAGIAAAGTGRSREAAHAGAVVERNGFRFGFLAYTYDQRNGNWPNDDDRVAGMDVRQMQADVAALRRHADAVLVSMHGGAEYSLSPHATQQEFARAAIDAGARAVLGHHPHVVQPVEEYRSGVIFYSLGNLVFDQYQREETQRSVVAELTFASQVLESYRVLPVDLHGGAPRLDLREPTELPVSYLRPRPERGMGA